jgi:hypothetical protein
MDLLSMPSSKRTATVQFTFDRPRRRGVLSRPSELSAQARVFSTLQLLRCHRLGRPVRFAEIAPLHSGPRYTRSQLTAATNERDRCALRNGERITAPSGVSMDMGLGGGTVASVYITCSVVSAT